ncbi:hypothetical protein CYLTODRAFT_488874 [Cylindrobasidium torrendii FP15055 ss-10]|uniref:N-acetyltransferase domain-containing protein n=1 Tax=Cylindrobasidium torrendii FP15055 ss-10 TaxID=1314674 RepID=A0A0D7BG10_9AGAR|nr:hypothetical protein CYLTODRAFT_488874 [Cylindrobasidium torrendii FP15055 ss-10]
MSAYGAIQTPLRTGGTMKSTLWSPSTSDPSSSVSIHHITLQTALAFSGLLEYLHQSFAQIIDEGSTYPQEGPYDQAAFQSYFFAADVLVGILNVKGTSDDQATAEEPLETSLDFTQAVAGRSWEESVIGFYYVRLSSGSSVLRITTGYSSARSDGDGVKPNYPGRSSHICNAGFVVPRTQQGHGYGRVLARSYLHYAPKLGYQASVFNLVYVNNIASVKLWERLGFTKAGRIPRAGRLRVKDGDGEEYVDAWVFYKSFSE